MESDPTAQPVTVLHVAFYGIAGDDGRLRELIDIIDRWSDDTLGIEEPPHSWATHRVPTLTGDQKAEARADFFRRVRARHRDQDREPKT